MNIRISHSMEHPPKSGRLHSSYIGATRIPSRNQKKRYVFSSTENSLYLSMFLLPFELESFSNESERQIDPSNRFRRATPHK